MADVNFLLANARAIAREILEEPDRQTIESIAMAQYFTELDTAMTSGYEDFPVEWRPF